MNQYLYHLQPYAGKNTRYTCPQCQYKGVFVRYVHKINHEQLGNDVGRCNREVNCGYHRTPSQHFESVGKPFAPRIMPMRMATQPAQPPPPVQFVPHALLLDSLKTHDGNHLVTFLLAKFTAEQVWQLLCDYEIGTSNHWKGATVFWQQDVQRNIRFGKIMLYNPVTGKRVKEPFPHFTTVHTVHHLGGTKPPQCLFGEHLLKGNNKPVAIVESEKTALIAAAQLPQYLWLATGGLQGLTEEKCKVLAGRTVTLFPDLNAYDKWQRKAAQLQSITHMQVSPLLQQLSNADERALGLDIGDYLLLKRA